jgi:poly(3-hydroxyoctanoate) depolymerase
MCTSASPALVDGPPRSRDRLVDVGGVRLRARVRGEGRPLLLITGLGASLDVWEPLERALTGCQTISYDHPGVGGSSMPLRPLRMRGLAELAARLLGQLGHDRADVVGVSLGGAVAQELAIAAPDRVRRLILAATTCGLGGIPGSPLALAMLMNPYRHRWPRQSQRLLRLLYGGAIAHRPELVEQLLQSRVQHPPSLAGYLSQLYAAAGWTSLPRLHRIGHATLVMAGDGDPIVPLANARLLARRIPNAHLEVFEGGGHLFLLDQAEEAAAIIGDFLAAPW